MRRWHIIQSKPHQADRVAAQLQELLALEVYNPRIAVRAVRGARKLTQVRQLFPNYLFARLDLPAEWKTITFRGVARVLGGWEDPRSIDDAVIEAIRARERGRDRLIAYYRFRPQEHGRAFVLADADAQSGREFPLDLRFGNPGVREQPFAGGGEDWR